MRKGNFFAFTIVELLIYMGIFSILLIVLLQMFTSILDLHLESQSTSVVSQDANFIMSKLSYDIKQASSVPAPALGSQGSTLQITGSGINNTYALSGGNLVLTNNLTATSDVLNSINSQISSITFKTLGNSQAGSKPTVMIVLTVKSKAVRRSGVNQTETFETTVGER